MPKKSSPFQAHKHHSKCQALPFPFWAVQCWIQQNWTLWGTWSGAGADAWPTPPCRTWRSRWPACGPSRSPERCLPRSSPLIKAPSHAHSAREEIKLDPEPPDVCTTEGTCEEAAVSHRKGEEWKPIDERSRTAHKCPCLQDTHGAALSRIAHWSVWIQSDSFPGSNTSVTGRVRERQRNRERGGKRRCSSHSEVSQCSDRFIYISNSRCELPIRLTRVCTENTSHPGQLTALVWCSENVNQKITSTSCRWTLVYVIKKQTTMQRCPWGMHTLCMLILEFIGETAK